MLAWLSVSRGADLHMAQLMPLPLTVSCFSEIEIGFTFLVLAHLGSPGKGPLNGFVCVRLWLRLRFWPSRGRVDVTPFAARFRDFCSCLPWITQQNKLLKTSNYMKIV